MAVTPSTSVAAAPRCSMPVWSMGNFDPHNPADITMVVSTPRLAFKGMTLAQLKAKIDSGYEVFAVMCGLSMGGVLGQIAPLYNVQTYPSSGEATKSLEISAYSTVVMQRLCAWSSPTARPATAYM